MGDVCGGRFRTSGGALVGAILYTAAVTSRPPGPDSTTRADAVRPSIVRSAAARPPVEDAAPALDAHDQAIVDAVESSLRMQLPGADDAVGSMLAEVAAAVCSIRRLPVAPSLTVAKYDAQRTEILHFLGAQSAKGATIWPPTSQTAVQRFGSWNEALAAAGLATNSNGRAKGQLRFDASAYDKAIASFIVDCESHGKATTYKAYGDYAAEHKGEVPSAAAVRKFYGGWNAALETAR